MENVKHVTKLKYYLHYLNIKLYEIYHFALQGFFVT